VMVKCVETTQEKLEMVSAAFRKVQTATVMEFYPTTQHFTQYYIPTSKAEENKRTMMTIVMSQQTYVEEMTRVALTGLSKRDPHTFRPLDINGKQSKHMIAEKIIFGLDNKYDGTTEYSSVYKLPRRMPTN
jgi:hypothetical protein